MRLKESCIGMYLMKKGFLVSNLLREGRKNWLDKNQLEGMHIKNIWMLKWSWIKFMDLSNSTFILFHIFSPLLMFFLLFHILWLSYFEYIPLDLILLFSHWEIKILCLTMILLSGFLLLCSILIFLIAKIDIHITWSLS